MNFWIKEEVDLCYNELSKFLKVEGDEKMEKVKVVVFGCGNIVLVYFKNFKRFGIFDVIVCVDVDLDKVRSIVLEFFVL